MNTAAQESAIGSLTMLLAVAMLCVALISLVRSLNFIFSRVDGRMQRTRQITKTSIGRILFFAVTLAVLSGTRIYWTDSKLRSLCQPSPDDRSRSDDGQYEAHYCYFKDTIVLRVYGVDGKQLLAERTYRDTSGVPVRLYWGKATLQYPQDESLGVIALPPSLYDRLMAKLP